MGRSGARSAEGLTHPGATAARLIPPIALIPLLIPLPASAETFAFPVAGVDTFEFAAGYPTMASAGDFVEGARSTPDLPRVNAISLHLSLDQKSQACVAEISFYVDGLYFAQARPEPGHDVITIVAEPTRLLPQNVVDTTEHRFKAVLTNDIAACGEGSHLRFIEDDSWIGLTFVEDDVDEDGYISDETLGDDCDDLDDAVHPGADELENGEDDDCDGKVDEGTDGFDGDGDGFSPSQGDCDDGDADVCPICDEGLNSVDDDCDGRIDEDFATLDPVETDPPETPTPTAVGDGGAASPSPTGGAGGEDPGCGCTSSTGGGRAASLLAALLLLASIPLRRRRLRRL